MNDQQQTLTTSNDKSVPQESAIRLILLKLFFAVFFVVLAVQLTRIQVVESKRYQTAAKKQYEQKFVLPGIRGALYDRNGNVLVSSTTYVSFAADPKIIENPRVIAERFATVFGRPASYYSERLERNEKNTRRFVWLERHIKPEIARRINPLDGIVVINEPKRLYHYDDLAAPLIGFTDIDNKGISGLELQFDQDLRGSDGYVIMQRDGLGRARSSVDYPRVNPTNGSDISLTIDLAYQSIAEEELKRGVEANRADAGLVVMLNPKTGEILALAHYPGFNPNNPDRNIESLTKNRAITDMFEPGSIFKLVTAAAAYEYKLIVPETRFDAEGGTYRVSLPRAAIRVIKDTHEHQWLTFREAMEVSSNIVMAKASTHIGNERLYRQARDFGFGIPTGINLPGEVRGRLKKPNEWSSTTLQSLSYGYEVAVTPLQIAAAYAAVANDGVLMKPFILRQVTNKHGRVIHEERPQRIRKVISEKSAALLTEAFEGVVQRGTGKEVALSTVRIAGKTGTSRKVIDGKYAPGSYTSSFAGYFPAEDPQIVCLVMMDNPKTRGYYGGVTSGPVFKNIAERIVNTSLHFSRTPGARPNEEPGNGITVPDVRNLQLPIAQRILEGLNLKTQAFGSGDVVVRQLPEPGKRVEQGDIITVALNSEATENASDILLPDVRGMSVRRAMNRLVIDDFDIDVVGSGIVVNQVPQAGTRVRRGAIVQLHCEPRPMASATLY